MREDQIAFLKSLPNASSFMRECLDIAIASKRGSTEKTICLFQGAEELQTKIASQNLVIEDIRSESEKIEEEIKKVQLFLKVARNVADGKFELQQSKGKWRALAPTTEGKYTIVTDGHDTEEEAEAKAKERGKIAIKNMKKELKELRQKKQRHNIYLQAQKRKLEDMEKNLEGLYASMK